MNKLSPLFIAIVILISGCRNIQPEQTTSAPLAPPQATESARQTPQGTGDSGGGGTVLVSTIKIEVLKNLVENGRAEIYMHFIRLSDLTRNPLFKKLFSGPQDIFSIIRSHGIYDGVCLDRTGNEVDGSIYSPQSNTICININRLAKKLDRDSARNQVLSLLAHEYSHLIGFSESEAQELQQKIYKDVGRASSESVSRMFYQTYDLLNFLRWEIDSYKQHSEPPSWNYLCYVTKGLFDNFSKLKSNDNLIPYSTLNASDRAQLITGLMRVHALHLKTCGQSDYHPRKKDFLSTYESVFKDSVALSADQYTEHFYNYATDPGAQYLYVNSFEIFATELAQIEPFISGHLKKLDQIKALFGPPIHFVD